jgi:hypothetical protein
MASTANRRYGVSQQRGNLKNSMDTATSKTGEVAQDVMQYVRDFVREKPETAALWCLGIGFVLGWKLKPW